MSTAYLINFHDLYPADLAQKLLVHSCVTGWESKCKGGDQVNTQAQKKNSPVYKLFWSAIRNQAAGRRMQNAKRSALVPQAQAHRARIRRDASARGSAPENIVSLYIGT